MHEAAQTDRSTLTAWAEAQTNAGVHIWCVVDGSAGFPTQQLIEIEHSCHCVNLLAHRTGDADSLSVAPRLCKTIQGRIPKTLTALWQRQTADEPSVFFVSTRLDELALIKAMQRRVRAQLPDGDIMLFRWWDPRIWSALQQMPRPDHPDISTFFSVIEASVWLSREGRVMNCQQSACDKDAMGDQAAYCALNANTFEQLMQLGEADAILGICRSEYPDALTLVPPEQRHTLAQKQIEWAMQQGFTSPPDHALAVRIAAELGADWHHKPEWAALIEKAKIHEQTLLTVLQED